MSEVALAIIEESGLEPRTVFDDARALALADRRGHVEFLRGGVSQKLYHVEGALQASFAFEGGHYSMGGLHLWGNFPETIAIGAKRRPLASYVDHHALRSTAVTVSRAGTRSQALVLLHKVKLLPVDEAG